MKNKLGVLMIVAILAMTFSCGSKKTEGTENAEVKTDSAAVVKTDSTATVATDSEATK